MRHLHLVSDNTPRVISRPFRDAEQIGHLFALIVVVSLVFPALAMTTAAAHLMAVVEANQGHY